MSRLMPKLVACALAAVTLSGCVIAPRPYYRPAPPVAYYRPAPRPPVYYHPPPPPGVYVGVHVN